MSSTIGSVGGSSGVGQLPPQQPPESITKDDLVKLRDTIKSNGGTAPDGLDKLIAGFDKQAGQGGKMSASEFQSYAKSQGVDLKPPQGGAGGPGGMRPPSGMGGPKGVGGAGAKASAVDTSSLTDSSKSSNVSTKSDAELEAAAQKGDRDAAKELKRREAAKEMSQADGKGVQVDKYT